MGFDLALGARSRRETPCLAAKGELERSASIRSADLTAKFQINTFHWGWGDDTADTAFVMKWTLLWSEASIFTASVTAQGHFRQAADTLGPQSTPDR
jgi:hypothetical protein